MAAFIIVAVDGPAASGKGTIARRIAAHYGWPHLDTGLLYRAVGKAALDAGFDPLDAEKAGHLARTLDLDALDAGVLATEAAGAAASMVASLTPVRAALLDRQRAFAAGRSAVLDGRDIGTVIFPEAPVKLFITASLEARAARRLQDELSKGHDVTLASVMADLAARDARDSGRKDAPLKAADDAVLLDTTEMSIETAVAAALAEVERVRMRG